jgi:hypothetical protein
VRSVSIITLTANLSPLLGLKDKAPIQERTTGKSISTTSQGVLALVLLVLMDTFTGRIEAFPCSTEKA